MLIANRDRFITPNQMEVDQRPFKEVIDEFGEHFFDMITAPEALAVQRMVIAETKTNPEVGTSFFEAGPRQTREMLGRFFARPEVRAQMRDDVDLDLLPSFLIQCVMGDPFSRFLFDPALQPRGRDAAPAEQAHGLVLPQRPATALNPPFPMCVSAPSSCRASGNLTSLQEGL
ncbi:TetR/AcrR family transcriptional regulator C-terminal domain-containing protein [Massilia sp. H-1]|nr:TetR/AcrR family transcriptional regulator C-terminal domain-containing protein [Massilia sp. H-1]